MEDYYNDYMYTVTSESEQAEEEDCDHSGIDLHEEEENFDIPVNFDVNQTLLQPSN